NKIKCQVCGTSVSSKKAWSAHLKSVRHQQRLLIFSQLNAHADTTTTTTITDINHNNSVIHKHIDTHHDANNNDTYNNDNTDNNNNNDNDNDNSIITTLTYDTKISSLLSMNEELFVELKTSHTLSIKTMNAFISLMKNIDLASLPKSYEDIEDKLQSNVLQ